MQIEQATMERGEWSAGGGSPDATLTLVFGPTAALQRPEIWSQLRQRYPQARIVGCSTAGEIAGCRVLEDSLVATSITFASSRAVVAVAQLDATEDSAALGRKLGAHLPAEGLVHVLVLSDGLKVNGSGLVQGIASAIPAGVSLTGGLSADGARFQVTTVCIDGPSQLPQVVAIGLYGDRLRIGYGSLGGWDPFGPERRITRAEGNVLHELDGEPALDLYKRYLGTHASGLPSSGLLFPLTIRPANEDSEAVVRTILSVDEVARTLTFAGDVPVGYRARLMRANFERLVDGASGAARACRDTRALGEGAELALLISCVGRKLVLKQRVEEEVEAVRDVLGPAAVMTGFYSYGEISPFTALARCELHNQTMTITTISEQ